MNTVTPSSNAYSILLPVVAGQQTMSAVRSVIQKHWQSGAPGGELVVHLLHVTPRLRRRITRHLPAGARGRFVKGRLDDAVLPVTKLLDRAGIAYQIHVSSSNAIAETIVAKAKRLHCSQIVVGSQRNNPLSRLLTNSVTGQLIAQSEVPVEVVLSGQASLLQRWGVPAGASAAMIALIVD